MSYTDMARQATSLPDEPEHDLLESRMMRKYHVRFGGGPMEKDWHQPAPRQRPTLRQCHLWASGALPRWMIRGVASRNGL
jgi:hypothetical protein